MPQTAFTRLMSHVDAFFQKEAAGGILLMSAAMLALICANSSLDHYYNLFLSTPVEIRVAELIIAKPLLLWINDGLMAIFFFLIGLELKREILEGELAEPSKVVLPGIGAVGGMLVPAAVYWLFNHDDPVAAQGWAIPAATDIAFALGVLALLGSRVPLAVKVFLTSLAIFDDIGAVLIIAFFYTAQISMTALYVVIACVGVLIILNRLNVCARGMYLFIGLIMWTATLKSGVHATLAGVVLAMFIPLQHKTPDQPSPLKTLEHSLESMVAFFVLPVFAFANAGITFTGLSADQILHDVPLGIALGLFVGKQVGIFSFCWLFIKLGWASLPTNTSWLSLYGTSVLCGIGFTMSLFIGSLAFETKGVTQLFDERLGILLGSFAAGLFGYLILNKSLPPKADVVNVDKTTI